MASVGTSLLSVEEFWEWASRPENQGQLFELDEGRVVEMPPPGELHGVVCFLITHLLGHYVFQRGKGYVCTNDTGLLIKRKPGILRGPDIMLFDESRPLSKLSRKYTDKVPKLVVEVLSATDQMAQVNRRISQYLKRGIPLVWLVDPETRTVTVYQPGTDLKVLQETDEITGEDVLPKFRRRVGEFFTLPGSTKSQ
ncbi:MAG: Uma2 family endonuclease [Gemmataceae bacterium]|nr:Uma2 family endonuclease [Gemmataceae bacterium]MDW8267131.1 Uma2 family endonuclease [Gemmataceae bacterium]